MTIQQTADRYSFNQLLSNNNFNIEIPIIQRDYAQGRDSQKELRTNFLGTLYKYLEEQIPHRDLDFIYGYITKEQTFVPLDGQQRLTTLFLLHWYLAKANNDDKFIDSVLLKNGKSKFIYKTRFSSTDFCEALLTSDIDLRALKEPDEEKNNAFSKTIMNKGWFQKYWSSDATVLSMLNMLDDIHSLFKDVPHFYEGLIAEQSSITFLFLNLDNLKQGDDIYIKMNSRGKALTNFENFKARFEQEISTLFKDDKQKYTLSMGGTAIEYTIQQYFSNKIDCIWTDLFWNYRNLIGDLNTYDDELMNFIRASLTFSYIEKKSYDKITIDLLLSNEVLSFNKQKELKLFKQNSVLFLIDSLDKLTIGNLKQANHIQDKFFFDFEPIFVNILKNTASIPERIRYYAYISYLTRHPNKISGIEDWMRVIANLVENTRFDGTDQFYSGILSVNKLLEFAPNILEVLNDLKIDFFSSEQVYEEQMKSIAILSDRNTENSWEEIIKEAEKAIFHKGQIGYLFEFCGFESKTKLKESLLSGKELIKQYLSKFKSLFGIIENGKNNGFLLERSLLTLGNYSLEAGNWRYNFSSSKRVVNYDRDYSWKRILRVDFTSSESNLTAKAKRRVFKDLVNSEHFIYNSDDSIIASLNSIISKSDVSDWRQDFIKDSRILETCRQGYIYSWEYNHRTIQLLNASQMNHLRFDLNTLVLYYQINDKQIFGPFCGAKIEPAKGYDDNTKITLDGWCNNRIHYKISLEYLDDHYYITFSKAKGNNKPEDYGQEIQALLERLGYKWEEYGFDKVSRSRASIFNKYKELVIELNNL